MSTNTALVTTEDQQHQRRNPGPKNDEGLTELQERFVDLFLANGGNGAKAARDLGGMGTGTAEVYASRTLRKPEVQAAIVRRSTAAVAAMVPGALKSLKRLSTGARSEYVKLEAVKDVLDRAGVGEQKPSTAVAIQVNIDLD